MSEMISFGAGVNSVAMTILLLDQGWQGPIVFADTGAEHPETYCYIDYFDRHFLRPRGLEIIRLSPGSKYHTRKSQLPLEEHCLKSGIIPILAVRWCSAEYKRKPLQNWAQAHAIDVHLMGICASEPRRIRDDPAVRYPLYEEDITRAGCSRIIQRAGLQVPIKSGCFFCPGQNLSNWRRLYYDHPELYERAAQLEDNASQHCRKSATLDAHGASLRQHAAKRWAGQAEMDFSQWLPCACTT